MTLGRWRVLAAVGAALALCAAAGQLSAQGGTITGRVTTAAGGSPLAETRVLVLGTSVSATTGEDGSFTLRNVPAGTAQLQALRVGYRSEKQTAAVTAGATATANFSMTVAVAQLDEVVTTATGQQRRAEIGNAVSTLPNVGVLVDQAQNSTISTLMEGKSSGVQVLPPNMTGGAPIIRIRGLSSISLSNAPIWIVDGVRFDSGVNSLNSQSSFSMINSLSTEEIEDIEIVKGPSAATLYGTAAANGVVLVTTKKGRAGKAKWGITAERGLVQDPNEYIMMYANFGHAPGAAAGAPSIRCKIATMVTSANPGGNCISDSLTSYNLMRDKDLTFVKTGQRSLYGVNVSGGSEQVRYFLSSDVDDEQGPIEMPQFEINRFNAAGVSVRPEWLHPAAATKMNFRGNLSAAISPKLDVNFNSGFARNENRLPPSGSSLEALYYVGMQNYGYKGCPTQINGAAVTRCGLDKITNEATTGTPLNEYFQYAPGEVMQRFRPQIVQRTTLSMNSNWRPFAWMQNDATIGVDLANRDNSDLCRLNECAPTGTTRQGLASDLKVNRRTVSAKLSSTGSWVARPWLNFKTTAGGDYTNVETDSVSASGTNLPPGASLVSQASTRSGNQGVPVADKTLGIYAQEVAAIRDRLFLTAAVRSDQNSAFGTKFQSILYPKASVSWMASDESFFPKMEWLNSFRLRGAYGASGVQPGRTDGLITFTAGNQNVRGADTPALAASQTGNPDLKPEKSTEWEGGFETQLWSNKIRLDYTAYLKKTKDALINVDIAPSSGAAQLSPLRNIGSTQNTGHELQLNAQILDRRPLAWDVTITASHESNKVLDLGIDPVTGVGRILGAGGATRQLAGYPINSRWFRGYHYADANGDGVLQNAEVTVDSAFSYMGYAFPRDIFSIQNGLDLLNHTVHVSALFDYRGGFTVQDGGNNFQCGTGPFACRETEDPTAPLQWQARNIAKVQGTTINGTRYTTTAGYLENGQFWKFRELSVAYNLPDGVRKYIRAQNGSSFVIAGRNLHTWTKYTGLDPEEFDSSNTDTQSNFQSAPPPRYVTFRVNLKY